MSISILLPTLSGNSQRPFQKRHRPWLDPIIPKKNQILPLPTFKSIPKFQDLVSLFHNADFNGESPLPNNLQRKLPKECIFNPSKANNPLIFIDLLTMNELEIIDNQDFFWNFSRKTTNKTPLSPEKTENFEDFNIKIPNQTVFSCKTLFFLSLTGSEPFEEICRTLDSLYENLEVFESLGFSESNFCVLLFYNGASCVPLEILEKVFKKMDNENGIPFPYTFEGRRRNFFADLENSLKKREIRMSLDSSYIYETDYLPIKEAKKYQMKVLWGVKLREISLNETLLWLIRGFGNYFQPDFCGFLSSNAILKKKSLWNAIFHFNNEKETGGIFGFEIPRFEKTLEISKDYDKIIKPFHKIFELRRFGIFGEIIEEIHGDWIDLSRRNFGLFRWENVKNKNDDGLLEVIGENLKGNLDFNRILGLEISCFYKIDVLQNVEVSYEFPNNLEDLMKRKKQNFTGNWLLMNNFFFFLLKKIRNNQSFSFRRKACLIYLITSHYFSLIQQSLCLCFMFSGLYVLSNLYLKEYTNETFDLFNIQVISIAYFLLFLCFLFHYSVFFRPEENSHDFKIISIFFSILFNVYLAMFIWKVSNLLLYLSVITYFVFPFLFFWKLSAKLLKSCLSYVYNKSLEIFLEIYCLTNFREDVSKDNSIFFEKMLIWNLALSLFFMVINSNVEISNYFIKIYAYYLIIFYCKRIIYGILGKIWKGIREFLELRRRRNKVFAFG